METFFVFDDQFYQDFVELVAQLKMSSFLFLFSMNFHYFFFGTLHRCLVEGMKAKFSVNVRAGLMIDCVPLIVKIF